MINIIKIKESIMYCTKLNGKLLVLSLCLAQSFVVAEAPDIASLRAAIIKGQKIVKQEEIIQTEMKECFQEIEDILKPCKQGSYKSQINCLEGIKQAYSEQSKLTNDSTSEETLKPILDRKIAEIRHEQRVYRYLNGFLGFVVLVGGVFPSIK